MDFILPQIEFFENGTWLDEPIEQDTNLRYWHIIFMALGCFLSVGELKGDFFVVSWEEN